MSTKNAGIFAKVALSSSFALLLGAAGCKGGQPVPAPITDPGDVNSGGDPAAVNMAPPETLNPGQPTTYSGTTNTSQPARVLGQSAQAPVQQQGEEYPQQTYAGGQPGNDNYDYESQIEAGQAAVYASAPPPPLPVYEQPPAPEPDYEWTPGYWNYASAGYYWVPGTWCAAPYVGALWTPPYWGFYSGRYRFHHGFWGRHVGFYGGVPYGYGYTGYGYEGGYWRGQNFYYNRSVTRVNVNVIHNVYEHNVTVLNVNNSRVSYNGGPGGWNVRPRPAEVAVVHEQRTPPMRTQIAVQRESQQNRAQFFQQNHGAPQVAARPQPVAAERGIQAPPVRGPQGPVNAEQQHAQQQRPNQQPEHASQQQHPAAQTQNGHPQAAPQQAHEPQRGAEQQNHSQPSRPEPQPHNQPQAGRPEQSRPANQPHPQPPAQQNRPQAEPRQAPQNRPQPQPQQARPEPPHAQPPAQQPRPQESRPQEPRPQPQARPEQPRPQPQPQQSHPEPQRPAAAPHQEAPHQEAPHEEHPKH